MNEPIPTYIMWKGKEPKDCDKEELLELIEYMNSKERMIEKAKWSTENERKLCKKITEMNKEIEKLWELIDVFREMR